MLTPSACPILELKYVCRRRGGRAAVTDLNLTLRRGEVLGLLGVNGAGKSTTLSMIAGALTPDSGSIALDGRDFVEHPELARSLTGWLPERAPVWQELTVLEHLHAHGRLRGLAGSALREACSKVIAQLELVELSSAHAMIFADRALVSLGTTVITRFARDQPARHTTSRVA